MEMREADAGFIDKGDKICGLGYGIGVIVRSLIIGALSGWLAGMIMKKEGSMLRSIILGFAGSFVGGIVFRFIGLRSFGTIGEILVSVVGACIVIFLAGFLLGKK